MCSIFNEKDWKCVELRGGDHIYSRYDTESDKMRYFYVSADGTSKQGIGKELYDFLNEEMSNGGMDMNNSFPIDSDVVCLERVLNYHYAIPAYQRPYEWNEGNLDTFLQSVFDGFEKDKTVFFGTMQVAESREDAGVYDIVDGQQRITTFILLFNVIQERIDGKYKYLESIENNPIKGVFGNERDAEWLKNYNIPKYIDNKNHIEKKLERYLEERDEKIDILKLNDYLLNNIYLVFLVTKKELPLSEVVAVFNTINTTGLDLNASDVFKFRYYDFLCQYYPNNEDWMKKINDCYISLERKNDCMNGYDRIEMSWILDVYKHIICASFELGYSDLSKSNLSFYDDLFTDDKYKEYKQHPVLAFETFAALIDIFVEFHRWIEDSFKGNEYASDPMELFSYHMIGNTRYSKYWTIPYVAAYFMLEDCKDINVEKKQQIYHQSLMINLSFFKLFLIYSVIYAKAINQVHNRVCVYLRDLKTKDYSFVCREVENLMWLRWIGNVEKDDRSEENKKEKKEFYNIISNDLYDNGRRAYLVCLLSALIDELDSKTPIHEIFTKLFIWDNDNKYDIEHIWARKTYSDDPDLSVEVKRELNGIGNLVVLERGINREIKDNSFNEKKSDYKKSQYAAVARLLQEINDEPWDLRAVKKRQAKEIEKLKRFMDNEKEC